MTPGIIATRKEDAAARHDIALLGAETGQRLSLRVQEVSPGQGTPLHRHIEQSETFYVLQGEFLFRAGDHIVRGGPGFTIHVPEGTPHALLCLDQTAPGKLMSILTPGVHDGFIQTIPEAARKGASMAELAALAHTFGAEILGPGMDGSELPDPHRVAASR